MFKDEMEAKKRAYEEQEEEYEEYLKSDPVKRIVVRDAGRIWDKVKDIFRRMPPASSYKLFVGYQYDAFNSTEIGRYTLYYQKANEPMLFHRLFFFKGKLKFPEETFDELQNIAEKEGIHFEEKSREGMYLYIDKKARGIMLWI